jgi:hypothetical protein
MESFTFFFGQPVWLATLPLLAAMLGLLLAFTVSMAVGRFEDRQHAVVDEANAIGTAYLQATGAR